MCPSPRLWLALWLAALLGSGCGDTDVDAGASDAAGSDAGTSDAASADAAPVDGGAVFDAGPTADAGARDAGTATLSFVGSWGGYGTEPGQFIEPSSVELDSEGFVYVAGHEDRFQKFTPDGELLDIYGSAGTGDGEFDHPHGLAVDRRRGDLIYVGDQENHRLQVFTTDGTFVRAWGDAMFQHIHDVGIDPESGDLFVGDYELDTLRRFSATGELLDTWGGTGTGAGEFDGVWGVSTDSSGAIYVADTFNRRIQKLDRDGSYLAEWSGHAGTDFLKPTGLYVDRSDRVYVCDSLADAVLVFDADGAPLERWDLEPLVGSPSEPEDIVLDAEARHVYVAEVRGHRVLHFLRDAP